MSILEFPRARGGGRVWIFSGITQSGHGSSFMAWHTLVNDTTVTKNGTLEKPVKYYIQ